MDLMDTMMKRVAQLEQANAELRVHIKTKSTKIESLEADNFIMSSGDSKPDCVVRLKNVLKEKDHLRKIVSEMTDFLSDYGLKWVGAEANEGAFNI